MLRRLCTACQQPYDPASVPRNNRSRCRSCLDEYEREKRRRRGKTAARGYSADWQRMAKAQIRRSPVCANCGATEDLTVDHIVPLSRGGTSGLENLRTLCRSCNGIKSGPKRGEERASETALLEERAQLKSQFLTSLLSDSRAVRISLPFFGVERNDPPNSFSRKTLAPRPRFSRSTLTNLPDDEGPLIG